MKKQFKILAVTSLVIAFTSCKSSQETSSTTPSKKNNQDVSQLFKQMDSNKDGKISKSEAKGKLKENFKMRDKNNDGFITKNEMARRNR